MSAPGLSFPRAQQAQIIRANQRDTYHLFSLRDQTESVLRSWLGTRWLTRWDKEVDLLVKLSYYGLTIGQAAQTLGEEYTDIWQQTSGSRRPPTRLQRAALVLLPTLPAYLLTNLNSHYPTGSTTIGKFRQHLPNILEIAGEVNLALFYLRGLYYDLAKRTLGIEYYSSTAEDPNTRPPSYSLLGILLATRLLYRLVDFVRTKAKSAPVSTAKETRPINGASETFIDEEPVSSIIQVVDPEGKPPIPAEEDERTYLDVSTISADLRAGRNCTLCLEERTSSCATDCGHMFCWDCIVGWAREKAECPLCRQSLSLTHLVPIYNL